MFEKIYTGFHAATMSDGRYGVIEDAALAVAGERIEWIGPRRELPASDAPVVDLGGGWITPGLIDCHTHLVFGGDRVDEFEQRLLGADYAEIARRGGGILSTVRATRAASESELLGSALKRIDGLLAEGVTTVEIKSGYGLDVENELKMLRVARELERQRPVTIRTTFLGAHALPPEYKDRADDYIGLVCEQMLPAVAEQGLADAVDAFCETVGFNTAQVERVFRKARGLDLPVKLHAEQLSNQHGTELAARFGALSADHLEYLDEAGVEAMAESGTVAVLLPGAFYILCETRLPPMEALRRHGVPMALATDLNPGTSPVNSLLNTLNLACTLFRMTPEEALTGATCHAARALGLADRGVLAPGKRADFVLWDIAQPPELAYWLGGRRLCRKVIRAGEEIASC
jgi:imidazolonepropionase